MREELDEVIVIANDLGMAIDIREQIEAGEESGLIDFSDGEKIKVPIPDMVKKQLDGKIAELTRMLKEKVSKIKL